MCLKMTDILYLHSFVLQLHTKLNWYMVATGQLMIQKNSLRLGKLQKVYLEKKSEILEKIQRIWMTLKWAEAIFTYDLWKTY